MQMDIATYIAERVHVYFEYLPASEFRWGFRYGDQHNEIETPLSR